MSLPDIDVLAADDARPAVPLHAVPAAAFEAFAAEQGQRFAAWAKAQDFSGQSGRLLLVPDEAGALGLAVLGAGKGDDKLIFGAAAALPAGDYRIAGDGGTGGHFAALGFALGAYAYTAFKPSKAKAAKARLLVDPAVLPGAVRHQRSNRRDTGLTQGRFRRRHLAAATALISISRLGRARDATPRMVHAGKSRVT